jgi:hypothetical protein
VEPFGHFEDGVGGVIGVLFLCDERHGRLAPAALAGLLSDAQKVAARAQPRIDALHATLTTGAPGREAIKERRWQAGYDLALGRVLAAKVRTDAYNQMLAQAKLGMKFQDEKNDTWQLEPSEEVTVGSQTEKLAKTIVSKRVKGIP